MHEHRANAWGEATAFLERVGARWLDFVLLLGLIGVVVGLVSLAGEWRTLRPQVQIDLSPTALPRYAFYSLSRGLLAYAFSLLFTLTYGYWAAKDQMAERVLVPLLDILQSIPVLGFMPGLVLALVAMFPHSNIGLELASIVMIFTGQVWNMTFSYYASLKEIPLPLREAAAIQGWTRWQTLRRLEIPSAMIGLVWNSMMSMAGGWFFLAVTEAFTLQNRD